MAVSIFVFIVSVLVLSGHTTGIEFSGVTWNINGVAKLRDHFFSVDWLRELDVIYLQETYSLSDESVLELPGYLAHHSLALYTGRRPSRGVSTLFRIEAFVDGAIQV
jgi:exonuclease III